MVCDANAQRRWLWVTLAIAAVMFLPWGALMWFNTKGEPREAIVAVSILQSGNWLLPVSYGVEFPFKPPMLGWIIAIFAKIFNGGVVNEYISRLPSALAAIGLAAMTFCWTLRHWRQPRLSALVALVMVTSFEVVRAAVVCRLDMLLTFFLVGSIYMLDTEGVKRSHLWWRYAVAIVMMTCATLTKGPIGACLPCLVIGVYRLWCHRNFWKTLGAMAALVAVSLIVPLWWAYAAYQVGGDEFYALMYEENLGRLFGTMSYGSHVHPWTYNLMTIAAGMLPYTVLVAVAIVAAIIYRRQLALGWQTLKAWALQLPAAHKLAICGAVLTFVFYCIPVSKRSVYLLPCYPFMAYGVVMMTRALRSHGLWQRLNLMRLVPIVAALYVAYLAVAQPLIFNPRSNRAEAQQIQALYPEGLIYTYLGETHIRYYTLNYYLDDRLRPLESMQPAPGQEALLITNPNRLPQAVDLLPGRAIVPEDVTFVSCDKRRDTIAVYRIY